MCCMGRVEFQNFCAVGKKLKHEALVCGVGLKVLVAMLVSLVRLLMLWSVRLIVALSLVGFPLTNRA